LELETTDAETYRIAAANDTTASDVPGIASEVHLTSSADCRE
jgi:hypothetical protein